MWYSFMVAGGLYVLWVFVPLIPSVLVYRLFPKDRVSQRGVLAHFTVSTIGAIAAYVIVFAVVGYPLVQTANQAARAVQSAAQADDTHRPPQESFEAIMRRAASYAKVGEYARAVKEYDQMITINGNDPALFNDRGALYEQLGGYDKAIDDYDRAIALNPNYALAFSNRCSARYKKLDYELAVKDCSRAITLDQVRVSSYIIRGDALRHLRKSVDALKDYDQALKLAPRSAAALFGRARAYDAQRDYVHSIADYTTLLDIGQDKETVYNNRCWVRAVIGELEPALADCDAALKYDEHDPGVLDSRGFVNLKLGLRDGSAQRLQSAVDDYTSALKIRPESASSLYGRGFARLKMGDAQNGSADIANAKRVEADIAEAFASYGVK